MGFEAARPRLKICAHHEIVLRRSERSLVGRIGGVGRERRLDVGGTRLRRHGARALLLLLLILAAASNWLLFSFQKLEINFQSSEFNSRQTSIKKDNSGWLKAVRIFSTSFIFFFFVFVFLGRSFFAPKSNRSSIIMTIAFCCHT